MEEHASSIWEALEKEYGKPGIAAIYQEFTGAMTTVIPDNSNPSFALEKIVSHFMQMATSKCVLPEHLKAMILISKMPPSMTALIQLVCQTDDINELNCDKIKKMIIHGWECQGGPRRSPEIQSTLVWSSCWGATGSAGRSTQRGEQRRVVRTRGNKGEVGVTRDQCRVW